ncbi:hypothetical protein ACP275_07G033700 [Erythranthe tilingii]
MAPKGIKVEVLIFTVALLSARATAQSGCTSVLISMASCLNYVSGSAASPSPSCCSALDNVVKTQPRCLCAIVNGGGGGSVGVNINQTLALGLPSACKVETPPISRCDESSPPESENGSPGSPISPSLTGSKTVPSNGAASNGSASNINLLQLAANIIVVFVTASYASAAFNNIF